MITTAKAAELANKNPSSIRRACEKGQIKGAELYGKTWLLTEEALKVWINTPEFHKTGRKART